MVVGFIWQAVEFLHTLGEVLDDPGGGLALYLGAGLGRDDLEEVGRWVNGWVQRIEENEAVQMRCCTWGLGGWVDE